MKTRMRLFRSLSVAALIAMTILAVLIITGVPSALNSTNQAAIQLRAAAAAKGDLNGVAVWDSIIETPNQINQASDQTIRSDLLTVAEIGLPIALLLWLLAWRNAAGILAARRHAEQMFMLKKQLEELSRLGRRSQ